MKKMEQYLNQNGYLAINLNYPSRNKTIENLSNNYLKSILAKNCPDKNKRIHFVTHSMSSLIVRYFLTLNKLPNLGKIVMLAPPNKASKLADICCRYKIIGDFLGLSLKQFTSNKESLINIIPPPDYDVGIIAAKYDVKIPIESTKLTNILTC